MKVIDLSEKTNVKKIMLFSILGLFILITILSSFTTINSGEVGLRVRFGKIIDSNLTEGLNFKIPYIERIVKVNIKVQKVEVNTTSASKDLQDIKTTLAVNYRVENKSATNLYKTVGNSYEQTILTPAIEEKQVAEQKLATAKLESEAKIVEAEATQKSNELLKQTLTDELIMKEFIDKWDGKLPETYAGDNIMGLFNLK